MNKNYYNLRFEPKMQLRAPTQRNPNTPKQPRMLKFTPINRQSTPRALPQTRPHDIETLQAHIRELKQQNNVLKNVIKIQQTQLSYYNGQQADKGTNTGNTNNVQGNEDNSGRKQARLKRQVQKLREENQRIRKSVKCTNIKQMEAYIGVLEERIKDMTGRIAVYERSTGNIDEINKIIRQRCQLERLNESMVSKLQEKNKEIEQSTKVIRKIRNQLNQKNTQIQNLRQEQKKQEQKATKSKNMEDYVHKSQLITKKKQLLSMAQTIEKLQLKLMECEAKIQALQEENVQNIGRQAAKRKEIMVELQKVKKINEQLQQALACTQVSPTQGLLLTPKPTLLAEQPIPKNPLIVTLPLIQQPLNAMIHSLQTHNIGPEEAISLLLPSNPSDTTTLSTLISLLSSPPFCAPQPQLLARYLCQSPSPSPSPFLSLSSPHPLPPLRSVLHFLLSSYPLYTPTQSQQYCLLISDYLQRNQSLLHHKLNQNYPQQSDNRYTVEQYMKVMEGDLEIEVIKFVGYWMVGGGRWGIGEFREGFGLGQMCLFVTQGGQ